MSINSHGLKVPEKCTSCWVDEEIVCFSWPPVMSCVFVLVEFFPEVQISRLCNENLGAELLTLQRTQKEKGGGVMA
jgi:hypothetical protein